MAIEPASLGGLDHATSPLPQPGRAIVLRTAAVLTANWVATDVVSIQQARRLTLYCAYAANAAGTGNRAQIRVMASAEYTSTGATPAVSADVWYTPSLVDATPTTTDLTGTKETGATLVNLTNYSVIVARPMAITLGDAADAGTDVQRYALTFDVGPYHFFYLAAKELGDTDSGQLGTLGVKMNLSLG